MSVKITRKEKKKVHSKWIGGNEKASHYWRLSYLLKCVLSSEYSIYIYIFSKKKSY